MSPKREHPDAAYVADLVERFGAFVPVTARRMFGGFGLFVDGAMFALVANGLVYLKVDEANRPAFEALGLQPWVYEAASRQMTMSYYPPPDEALDDPALLREWFEGARAASRRAAAEKASRVAKRKPKG